MANVQVGWIGQRAADVLSSERYPRLDVAPNGAVALRRGIRPQVLLKSAAPAAPSHRTAIDCAGPR